MQQAKIKLRDLNKTWDDKVKLANELKTNDIAEFKLDELQI